MASWLRSQFLKVVEYKDDAKDILVYRYPMGDKEFMKGSKITVREGQVAIFVHKGQIADMFTPGMYTLDTDNIPIITSIASWKYFFETPFKADVYFVNMRQFTDEKWGTINPIIVRDKDFGMVRVRGFGKYSFRVSDPKVFLKELFGTSSNYTRTDISSYLRSILVSAITDTIAEAQIPVLDLAANTLEFNQAIKQVINHKFLSLGLELVDFFVENISVPEEVEKAMDTRSSMGVMGDKMKEFIQYQAALGIRDAAQNEGGGLASAGVGLGAGVGIGSVFSDAFKSGMSGGESNSSTTTVACGKCGAKNSANAKFCVECGAKIGKAMKTCPKCKAEISEDSKFCRECGFSFAETICPKCQTSNEAGTKFCRNCGEKLV